MNTEFGHFAYYIQYSNVQEVCLFGCSQYKAMVHIVSIHPNSISGLGLYIYEFSAQQFKTAEQFFYPPSEGRTE